MRAPDFWQAPPGLASGLLLPLAGAWEAAGRLRRAAARQYRAPVPVVCVGNLVAGGAGKTPVALALTGLLAARGIAAHVVGRGYGGRLAGPLLVDPARHDATAVGDEAPLIATAAPCWVARDRALGVQAAVAGGAAAVVLDDGFQNPLVAKDLSLLVVDAEYGFGNGRVIPAGPLRETAASGLARADAVVLLGEGALPEPVRARGCPVLRARLEPIDGGRLTGVPVVAFAGIGRPAKFFSGLRALGARVVAAHPFPDHHPFAEREILALRREAERAGARLLTTAKDRARLPPAWRAEIEVLDVAVAWQEPAAVTGLLCRILRTDDGRRRSAAGG